MFVFICLAILSFLLDSCKQAFFIFVGATLISVLIPHKKRNSICAIMQNEKVFPLKKRRSLFSFNQEENENDNEEQDKVEEEIISEKAPEENMNHTMDQENNIEAGKTEGANPISLIAIAASFLTDTEDENQQEINMPSIDTEATSQGYERRRITKPRSMITRKRRTDYAFLTNHNVFAVATLQCGEEEEEHENENELVPFKEEAVGEQQQQEEVIEDDGEDLYTKVKRRSGRMAAAVIERSRCSRVNGKGWRCLQLARAGYSLCDHHLGRQERLRQLGNLGSSIGPKKRPGRPKGKNSNNDSNTKTRSLKVILEQSEPICKW